MATTHSNLFQQLVSISAHARQAAAERQQRQEEQDAMTRQRQKAAQQAWETRKDGGKFGKTGLAAAVVARLPVGEKNAVFLSGIEALVADVPHAPTGLSATLVALGKQGLITRIGKCRAYRYFKPQ